MAPMRRVKRELLDERTTQMKRISKEYSMLFNAITDTESELARIRARLIRTQQDAEEAYIKDEEDDDNLERQDKPA